VINVRVNSMSTMLNLTHSAINGLHCPMLPKQMYRSALLQKKEMIRSLPNPKNERQRSVNDFWHCIMTYPVGCAGTVCHNQTIGHHSIEQWWWQHSYYVLKMSVNRASTIFGHAPWKFRGLCGDVMPKSCYWPPFWAEPLTITSLLCPKNERLWSVNEFGPCIMENPSVVRQH